MRGAVFAFSGIFAVEGRQALYLAGVFVCPPQCNGRIGPGEVDELADWDEIEKNELGKDE